MKYRALATLAVAAVVGAASATIFDSCSFTGVLSGPGTTGATGNLQTATLSATGYSLGKIYYSGSITQLNTGDFASENRVQVTHGGTAAVSQVQFSTTTSYTGTVTFSGFFMLSPGSTPPWANPWQFSFYNTIDDAPAASADASVDVTFNFSDELPTPPASTDLGNVVDTTPNYLTPDLATSTTGGAVKWYKIGILENINNAAGKFFDIDTEGSNFDTEVGIYDAFGQFIGSDDDDGSGSQSQLSFGLTTPTRAIGTSVGGNGRDGSLLAGTYYVAVGGFNTTFGSGFNVTTTSTNTTGLLNLNFRTNAVPEPATLAVLGLGAAALIRRRRK